MDTGNLSKENGSHDTEVKKLYSIYCYVKNE